MLLTRPNNMRTLGINPLDLVNIKDILGCFHYLRSNSVNLNVDRLERDYSIKVRIIDINENSNKITVKTEKDIYFKSNENIKISFVINSVRYSFHSFVNSIHKEEEFLFNIPTSINYDDNRLLPRIGLSADDSNSLELYTGYFSGIKIKGIIKDISLGGLSFIPDSVENLRNRYEIDLKDAKIHIGDKIRSLKFTIENDLIRIPGEVCHTPSNNENHFGVKFGPVKGKYGGKLKERLQSYIPRKRFINFSTFFDNIKTIN